jgi:pimeloyl-ACP methyl ester carboxylesterase
VADDERLWLEVSVVQVPETLDAFRLAVKPGISTADFPFVRRVYSQELSAANLALAGPFEGPSLVLAGRQDAWCGYLDAADLAESLPRATIAVLDRAGHALAGERPVIFRALVADWVERMALEDR